jgi:hypothetical protein
MYGGFVVAGSSDFTETVKIHWKDAEVLPTTR